MWLGLLHAKSLFFFFIEKTTECCWLTPLFTCIFFSLIWLIEINHYTLELYVCEGDFLSVIITIVKM